jgi:hypothetical protein
VSRVKRAITTALRRAVRRYNGRMADIVFVAVALAFFGLCALYVRGFERLMRGSEEEEEPVAEDAPAEVMS